VGLERGSRPSASIPAQADALTYEPSFGLTEKAFSLNADSKFVYNSPAYAAVRQSLLAGIRRREGILVLSGQIGAGKTTLCREVLGDLGRNTYSSLVPDPFASREDLLKMMLVDFGAVTVEELTTGPLGQASRTELGYRLVSFIDALGPEAYAVVMIDEAQNLSLPLIEETRLLSDTLGAQGRLQLVLVGQPELHAKLKLPEMRQVDQRICGYHRLLPMDRDAVAGYIAHRLSVAGGHGRELFAADLIDTIHLRSGGVPRLVNRICDRALQLAFERKASHVERDVLDAALLAVGAETLSPNWDAIVFADAPAAAPVPAVKPAPAPVAPPAAAAPASSPEDSIDHEIKEWLAKELAPPSRSLSGAPAARAERPGTNRRISPAAPAAQKGPRRSHQLDWPRSMRSQTNMERLMRLWAKWAACVVGGVLATHAILAGAAYVLALENASVERQPSAVAAPAALLSTATATAAPVALVASVAPVAPVEPAASGFSAEYFVAVGIFADPARADRLVELLTRAGMPAMQRSVQRRQSSVQQIVLGPFFSQAEAAADLKRLQALGGYNDARVVDGR